MTPPGRPAHTFSYTSVDFTEDYVAPDVGVSRTTDYAYNLDKQLTRITRPDGKVLDFGYDTGGRLSLMALPRGTVQYVYNAATGKVSGVTAPDGGSLAYTYDGPLPLSSAWAGAVPGSVVNTYNNDFRLASRSVNGGSTVNFGYDNDGLLTQAGSLALSYNANNGLPVGTTLGSLTTTLGFNTFAELEEI